MRRFAAFLIAAGLAATSATARRAIDPTPKINIAKAIVGELKGDFTRHNQAEILAAIKPVDINGDSIADWQVNWNTFGSAWCGTGGCRYQLWLGSKSGVPLKVFDRQMRALKIEHRSTRNVFVFDFHGSECGGFGAQACPGEFAWASRLGKMALLPTPRKHTSNANPIAKIW